MKRRACNNHKHINIVQLVNNGLIIAFRFLKQISLEITIPYIGGDIMARDPLESYHKKRDFKATPEPSGGETSQQGQIFAVQKHSARTLHYDLRLEVNGVLKSWAIPKGPSANPKDKRLAILTEDHPLEYASFEGVIPKGQYGAGRVIVWDIGTYRNITQIGGRIVELDQALENGHISVWLEGRKLQGGYALTRTPRGWILIKMKDEKADVSGDILISQPRSVLSEKTIEEMADSAASLIDNSAD